MQFLLKIMTQVTTEVKRCQQLGKRMGNVKQEYLSGQFGVDMKRAVVASSITPISLYVQLCHNMSLILKSVGLTYHCFSHTQKKLVKISFTTKDKGILF